ncbi:MAG: U32 family peptidase [Bacteriovorax sp.]|nr:U32 family peptidase [Bacteriovorax sp.]
MTKNQKSELLLPVGNMNMCLAAIHNGADAIYVGMPHFNARGRTTDFSVIELKEMIEICHLYGVKVNLAFNVVIFEDEYPEVIELLTQVLPLAPDALIVQDVGLASLVRKMAPHQILHGSTQMTVTNHEAMTLLDDLSIKRFVLGREVSIPEMKAIKEKTDRELEVFVHGALCVAYSGQCFTSESIGGRSANRGQCAQSCRFEYDLIVDGTKKELGDKKYLVSPKDLCGIAQIPELLDLGIDSFKVEGRLKTPEYVAAAAKNYSEAIDTKLDKKTFSEKNIEDAKREMGLTYSRGFYSGWLNGVDHQELVDGTFGAHRGVDIGSVLSVGPKSIKIKSQYLKLKKGDGVLLASSINGKKIEIGGMLYDVSSIGPDIELFFSRDFDLKKIRAGFKVYFNHDATVEKALTQSYSDKNLKKRIPLSILVKATIGCPLELIVNDGTFSLKILSESIIEASKERPTTKENLESELGALSGTCFILHEFSLEGDNNFFINNKELKILRREFTSELMAKRIERSVPAIFSDANILLKNDVLLNLKNNKAKTNFNILLRELNQVKEFLVFANPLKDILGIVYLDYEFGKEYAVSVELLRNAGIKVGIATTRILKPNEYYNFKVIERANPDVILCRNLGAVQYFKDSKFELRGDFSLNVTNSLSANYFLTKNLKSVCASYDLSDSQLNDLLKNMDSGNIEVTIHQYMPSFHMEHCVFAAFLSTGSSFKDCGKPCEKHRVELKDQFGNFHQIKADQECRNTMFNATSQSAAKLVPGWKALGLTEFRFEALYELGADLKDKILAYAELIRGDSKDAYNEDLMKKLGVLEKYGLSQKAFDNREYKNKKSR